MCKEKLNRALKNILIKLYGHRYVGGKHITEGKFIGSRIKWLGKDERKEFNKQYKDVQKYFIRSRKRTGKGYDWHISINPKFLDKIKELISK